MKPFPARSLGLALILLALAGPLAFGAGTDGASPAEGAPAGDLPEGTDFGSPNPFEKGTQTIGISAGLQAPLFTFGGDASTTDDKLKLGGLFAFQYQNFVAPGLALGGTISGAFNGTIGGRSLFIAPLSFRTAYWWSLLPFELCVGVEAGGYLMRLEGKGMLGPFAKAGGGAYWRSSPSWSLGLQTYYWLVPEIHTGDYADLTRFGNFLEVGLSAVYHL